MLTGIIENLWTSRRRMLQVGHAQRMLRIARALLRMSHKAKAARRGSAAAQPKEHLD